MLREASGSATRPHEVQGTAGSGTLLVVGLAAVAVFGLLVILTLASVASAAGRAATAADLAALAAADAARGLAPGEPCAVASETARRNGARLEGCRRSDDGVIVDVWTSVPVGPAADWLARVGIDASGRARAGPPTQPWAPPG
ncbi:Rv3654c family TadE-like protein [Arthrobacter sp. JSM 101049]|uniref:Rv3654c family TadE-like protein n=1 Tax=Arthrobacter sp. JSM 101049 TaxID=929097 RepID=UPI003567AAEE